MPPPHASTAKRKFLGDAPADVQRKAIELCSGSFGLYETLKVAKCKTVAEFDAKVAQRKKKLSDTFAQVAQEFGNEEQWKEVPELFKRVAATSQPVEVSAALWRTAVMELVRNDVLTPTEEFFVVAQDPIARQVIAEAAKK